MAEDVLFFEKPEDFRKWLQNNHQSVTEQWVGFYKKHTQLPSITWPESVDQALCFGWIDGLRRSIDDKAYKIRFTPRNRRSHWSAVNIKRIKELQQLGLVTSNGWEVFNKRSSGLSKQRSYEQSGPINLSAEYQKTFKEYPDAWKDFADRTPSYRKQCVWWVMSAKRKTTQEKRLGILIEACEQGQKIPPLRWQK